MALQDFLRTHKVPGNILEILVIKKIRPFTFVVGDDTGLALLNINENPQHEKDIKTGTTMKLLKPIVIDNKTLETNKNFKPLKSKNTIELKPSKEDLDLFETENKEVKANEKLVTFSSVRNNQSQTQIPCLTAIVTNVSRIIETNNGKYQIAGLMDIESQRTSINLYDSNINKLEFSNIYTFTKIKKAMIRKDDNHEMRLMTTKFTKISIANEEDKSQFENMSLGESQMEGTVIGFSEINIYNSCDKHWNKLDEDDICPKCEGPAIRIRIDFHAELYLQDSESDSIKTFLIFKRHVKGIIN